jgi:hypothetical protein
MEQQGWHQQSYNLLVHFLPLFDFLPKFSKPKAEKAEKLIYILYNNWKWCLGISHRDKQGP